MSDIHFQIRQFIQFDEEAARSEKIEPRQLQLLFTIKGLPAGHTPTMGVLADRLGLKHHTMVELANRLVQRGAIRRQKGVDDRRQVFLEITETGEAILTALLAHHAVQLKQRAVALLHSLDQTLSYPVVE